jgi:hypothetical protein
MYKQAICLLSLTLIFIVSLPAPKAMAQYDDAYLSYNDFYQNLSPYGQWIEDPQYGFVWVPEVEAGFRPYYTNGYWVMTDYGNTWVSDYPWGWAAFHYGRWTYDNYYGWIWIPGSTWGPSWVSWRYGEGYYGWAPLGPGYEFGGAYADYSCPNDWWVFIPPQYVYSGNYYRYWYGPRNNNKLVRNTVFMNNTYENNRITYVSGPNLKHIEQTTHKPVQVYRVTNSTNLNTHVKHNVVRMYRPSEIRPVSTNGTSRITPPNVIAAPRAVRGSQAMNTNEAAQPQFRTDMPRNNSASFPPGTRVNETATPPTPTRHTQTRPYEWDVRNGSQRTQNVQPQQSAQPQQSIPTQAQQTTRQQANPAPAPRRTDAPRQDARPQPGRR